LKRPTRRAQHKRWPSLLAVREGRGLLSWLRKRKAGVLGNVVLPRPGGERGGGDFLAGKMTALEMVPVRCIDRTFLKGKRKKKEGGGYIGLAWAILYQGLLHKRSSLLFEKRGAM